MWKLGNNTDFVPNARYAMESALLELMLTSEHRFVCVTVCVCVRERGGERESMCPNVCCVRACVRAYCVHVHAHCTHACVYARYAMESALLGLLVTSDHRCGWV